MAPHTSHKIEFSQLAERMEAIFAELSQAILRIETSVNFSAANAGDLQEIDLVFQQLKNLHEFYQTLGSQEQKRHPIEIGPSLARITLAELKSAIAFGPPKTSRVPQEVEIF